MEENQINQAQEQEQEVVQTQVVSKGKNNKGTGDLIVDVATKVENLTKAKALDRAAFLAENIETNYFELGGVLKVIHDNSWFEGHDTFDAFVLEKFGFAVRKAKYLMEIYDHLVTKHIPWEKVVSLGWTKLKDLARELTPENVDEWVTKASTLTVAELQAVLKGNPGNDGAPSTKTNDDAHKIKFTVKADQLETIQSALSKAKAEANTEYDSTALEMICTGYLGGSISAPSGSAPDLKSVMQEAGWEKIMEIFNELFPEIDVVIDPNTVPA